MLKRVLETLIHLSEVTQIPDMVIRFEPNQSDSRVFLTPQNAIALQSTSLYRSAFQRRMYLQCTHQFAIIHLLV